MQPVLAFLLSGTVVVVAGSVLARMADAISEHTGLGRLWVGAVLLAAATSLPELATDVAAVRIGAPDLAVGDLFGSSLANMLILALIDLLLPRRRLFGEAAFDHALSACLAIVLNAAAALFVLARMQVVLGGVGLESAALLATYVAGTRAVYRQSVRRAAAGDRPVRETAGPVPTLGRAILGFSAAAAAILVASPVLARSAEWIARATGLGTSFVGTWLVGLATSLPELVSSVAAVRLGAYDLAVGNLFGSNGFNMAILFALDVVHPGGPILAAVEPVHALSGLLAVVLMSLGLAAIVYRAERRFAFVEPSSVAMVGVYVLGLLLLYMRAAG